MHNPLETVKIARACAIGGGICVAVALAVTPGLWWLGLLAGFAAGYLAYEFRPVLHAVPGAMRAAWRGTDAGTRRFAHGIGGALTEMREWFAAREHPFFFLFLGALMYAAWYSVTIGLFVNVATDGGGLFWLAIANAVLFAFFPALPIFGLLMFFVLLGADQVERRYWSSKRLDRVGSANSDAFRTLREELHALGRSEAPLTYPNVLRWLVKGAGLAVGAIVWFPLRYFVWEPATFLWRCVRNLVLAIHSDERLLCGVYAAIGGGIATLWAMHRSEPGLGPALLAIAFGALLGAAFGVVNYRVVSPRLAKHTVRW